MSAAAWWLFVAILWLMTGIVHEPLYIVGSLFFFALAAAIARDERSKR